MDWNAGPASPESAVWEDRVAARHCFESLMFDERGTRRGFPHAVMNELAALRHYYFTKVFPDQLDPWQRGLFV
jgi:hypothetical protein